jgi:hypothetical protein
MERILDPVFLQARAALEESLGRVGFRLIREVLDHAAFGSAQAEYRSRAHWLRLTWDGKDRYIWLSGAISQDQHAHPAVKAWYPLDKAPGGIAASLQIGPATDARIVELLAQVERFRHSSAAV